MLRRWTAAVGVIAACAALILLAGCGVAPVQMGAAAIVGGQRITTATLADDVAALDQAYQANPSVAGQLEYKPAQMPQLVLTWLVRFQILDSVARTRGIQITPGDEQRGLAAAEQLLEEQAQQSISTTELALANAIPPSLLPQYGRFEATLTKLTALYTGGRQPTSQQDQQAQDQIVNQQLAADVGSATRKLDIKVNPRYGQLDTSQLTIGSAPDELSRPGN